MSVAVLLSCMPCVAANLRQSKWPSDAIDTTLALFGGLAIREYVVDSRYVPSASMEPTFEIGDRFLLEKVSLIARPPAAGDVVCFRAPPALEKFTPPGSCYIKRVVAIPGDVVSVRDGQLFVNGSPVHEPYLKERIRYRLRDIVVPSGHVFVLGDNRNNSYDSHEWGCLSSTLLLGRPLCLFWPPERIRGRKAFNRAPTATRRLELPTFKLRLNVQPST